MCGIVEIIGQGPAAPRIITALKRLEYRGYDSAGVATLEGAATRARARRGQTEEPRGQARDLAAPGPHRHRPHAVGDARQTDRDQRHPHASERLAVVHNGIIENFRALREELKAKGYRFATETDTEVAAFLVTAEMDQGKSPADAVLAALRRMRGAFALVFLFKGEDDLLIGARQGAPLAVGYGENEMFLGSDALALAPFTDRIAYLDEGDWVVVTRGGAEFRNLEGARVSRRVTRTAWVDCSPRRAIIATSWPKRFTSSPKSSATQSRIIST